MVCYMYYTDVFVGTKDNIDNLKKALEAELKDSGLNDDLTQLKELASGLESFLNGIKNTGGSQYASSYDSSEATWEKLCQNCQCKSFSKPSRCSCKCGSSLGSSVCDPKDCCENCDVRKAAKIFLGFLPCLYYALKYLYDRCKGGWNTLNISDNNKPLRRFLIGMGYDVDKELIGTKTGQDISSSLSSLINGSDGILDKIYKEVKKYFTSRFTSRSHVISSPSLVPSSDSTSQPKTVRDILLWLSGLPFTSGFKALLKHCEGLCKPLKDSVNFNDFKASLFDSCFLSPFVLGAIEDSEDNESEGFPLYKSEWQKFSYPSDPSDLLEKLCEYTRKVFPPLKFLCMQCELDKDQGGWKDCAFGQGCAEKFRQISSGSSSTSVCCSGSNSPGHGILCTSVPGISNCHEHCIKQGNQCLGSGPCPGNSASSAKAHTSNNDWCNPCPHPLMAFICDSDPSNFKSLFRFPQGSFVTRMGFLKDHLPATAKSGESLLGILEPFCGSKTSPLTLLVKFLTCISRAPPENLGEFFSFFKVFVPKLTSNFEDYASEEPGTPDGPALKNAIVNLYDDKGKHNGSSHSSGDHSVADLFSLSSCHAPTSISTCGPYLNLLTEDVYKNFIEDSPGLYLSWVCHVPRMFREKVEEFQKKFSDCCSKSSCKTIIYCPCAWPLISSQGFNFMSLSTLACVDRDGQEHTKPSPHRDETDAKCTQKSCKDFIAQLGKVVGPESPLQKLLDAIEKFLWSIRKPFFLFVLAFWAFVISYFFYVQLYKLDLLHIDSHLHLPRSFKILPSTLFSDASSKLKDLSYFTL
ncbi:variant erythrocyte surface antigen-1 family protein [Babesia divergens]|uniref:Variant erythrocyte surface antigen-1 family protein n=1 Tax=Babesia divergens TaxID=32595 RepID=A0AAD9LIJ2_BABDI|nr:variant erythrocyte surface antigen-1 family protein [Babesia divergens]